jgi:hypothetical protein
MLLTGMEPKSHDSYTCKIKTIAENLDAEDAELLYKFLNDKDTWSSNGLSNSLRERGVLISIHTVIKHRKGLCAC